MNEKKKSEVFLKVNKKYTLTFQLLLSNSFFFSTVLSRRKHALRSFSLSDCSSCSSFTHRAGQCQGVGVVLRQVVAHAAGAAVHVAAAEVFGRHDLIEGKGIAGKERWERGNTPKFSKRG